MNTFEKSERSDFIGGFQLCYLHDLAGFAALAAMAVPVMMPMVVTVRVPMIVPVAVVSAPMAVSVTSVLDEK